MCVEGTRVFGTLASLQIMKEFNARIVADDVFVLANHFVEVMLEYAMLWPSAARCILAATISAMRPFIIAACALMNAAFCSSVITTPEFQMQA